MIVAYTTFCQHKNAVNILNKIYIILICRRFRVEIFSISDDAASRVTCIRAGASRSAAYSSPWALHIADMTCAYVVGRLRDRGDQGRCERNANVTRFASM